MTGPLARWWGGKALSEVNKVSCKEYVDWRIQQQHRHAKSKRPVTDQTARHELKTLRASINHWAATRTLDSAPTVTMPQRSPQRQGYWLTRQQVAARIREARRSPLTKHLTRFILIGGYTGTRPGTVLHLSWLPSPIGGWFDLEAGILYRRGMQARRARNKNQPPARIHEKLLPHLRRWRTADLAKGITRVVHYRGRPVEKLRRSWDSVRDAVAAVQRDAPHICATRPRPGRCRPAPTYSRRPATSA